MTPRLATVDPADAPEAPGSRHDAGLTELEAALLRSHESTSERIVHGIERLGERFEGAVTSLGAELRQDVRAVRRDMLAVVALALVIVAAIAGASVSLRGHGVEVGTGAATLATPEP